MQVDKAMLAKAFIWIMFVLFLVLLALWIRAGEKKKTKEGEAEREESGFTR